MPKMKHYLMTKVPGFTHRGFRFPEAEVAISIENLGSAESAYELHSSSVTLSEARALYELQLSARMGEDLSAVPDDTLVAVLQQINPATKAAVWTDDACDYETGRTPRGVLVPTDYMPVKWVKHPILRRHNQGWYDVHWEVLLSESSEETNIFLPPRGFVVPTTDGLYRPDTGTPFATEEERREAVKLLDAAGLNGDEEASYFWPKSDKSGVCAVFYQSMPEFGRFAVHADFDPMIANIYIGSRPINRSSARKA